MLVLGASLGNGSCLSFVVRLLVCESCGWYFDLTVLGVLALGV